MTPGARPPNAVRDLVDADRFPEGVRHPFRHGCDAPLAVDGQGRIAAVSKGVPDALGEAVGVDQVAHSVGRAGSGCHW